MGYFYDFISEYKAILIIKINNVEKNNYSEIIKEVAKATLMVILVSLIIGYFTKSLENLNYVVYISNITLLGSFVLYMYLKEVKYQAKINKEYSIVVAISIKIIMLLGVVSLTNSLLYFFIFKDMVTIYDLYFLIGISLLVQLVLFILEIKTSDILHIQYDKIVVVTALWQFVLMIALLLIMHVRSVTLAYTLGLTILVILYLLTIYLFNIEHATTNKEKRYFSNLIVVLLVFLVMVFLTPSIRRYQEIDLIEEIPNIEKTYTLDIDLTEQDISVNSEYLFVVSDSAIYVYTHEFILEKEISFTADITWSYVSDDVFYIMMIEDENDTTPYGGYEYNTTVFNKLNSDNELEYILESIHISYSVLIEYDGGYIVTRSYPYLLHNYISSEGVIDTVDNSVDYEIIIQNEEYLIYTIDNGFVNMSDEYSDGYIIVSYDRSYYIFETDDFFNSVPLSQEGKYELLDEYGFNNVIEEFHIINNEIVARFRDNTIKVYDIDNYNIIAEYEPYSENLYIDDYMMFSYEENIVYLVDYNQLYSKKIITNNDIAVKTIAVLILGLYLVVEPKSLLSKKKVNKNG